MEELKQAAIACLVKALKGDTSIPMHIVQAALAVVLSPEAK